MSSALHLPVRAPHEPAVVATGAAYHNSRLLERQIVVIGVELCPGDEHWLPGRVTDISREGCRLVSGCLVEGMTAQIMFPGFAARDIHVVWADDQQAGCTFEPTLPSAILDYIIRMSDPAARG